MWKVYYWIYLVLTVIGLLMLLPQVLTFNLATWEGIVESCLLVLGTYSFIYKRQIFKSQIWRMIFIVILTIWVIQLIVYSNAFPVISSYLEFLKNSYNVSYGGIVFSMILASPALIATYRLAFKIKKILIKFNFL